MKNIINKLIDDLEKLINIDCEKISLCIYKEFEEQLNKVKDYRKKNNIKGETANQSLVKSYISDYIKKQYFNNDNLKYNINKLISVDLELEILRKSYCEKKITKKRFIDEFSELQAVSIVKTFYETDLSEETKYYLNEIDVYKKVIEALNNFLEKENAYLFINLNVLSNLLDISSLNCKEKYQAFNFFLTSIYKIDNLIDDSDNKLSIDNYKEAKEILKDYKINDLKELNNEELKDLLTKLNISEKLINNIIKGIKKIKEEEIKKDEEIKDKNKKLNITSTYEIYKDREEEKKRLYRELSNYFEITSNNMHLKKFLNREETNRVIYILKELNYSNDVIFKFLSDNEVRFFDQDLITKYEYIKPVLEYYKNDYCLQNEYNDLIEYYNGYIESLDEESKILYRKFLDEQIIHVKNSIPKGFIYELKVIK